MSDFPDVTPEDAIRDYAKFKEQLDEATDALKEAIAALPQQKVVEKLEAKLNKIKSFISYKMQELGTDSLGVKGVGSFTANTTENFNIENFEALTEWMQKQDEIPFQMFYRKLNQSNVKEVREVNGGELPPGVSVFGS